MAMSKHCARLWHDVPESADFVMYWWDNAGDFTRAGRLRRFGLITTNSLRQTFNRRVIERHMMAKPPLSLTFAIPDHPWVDSAEGAAVRIAMTVGRAFGARVLWLKYTQNGKQGMVKSVSNCLNGKGESSPT